MFGRFPGIVVGALMLATAGAAEGRAEAIKEFSEAGWRGVAWAGKDGQFSYCDIESEYRSGATLLFILSAQYELSIGLHRDWLFRNGQKVPAELQVDSTAPFTGTGTAISEDAVKFFLGTSASDFDLFRAGRQLHVRFDGKDFYFLLDGTARALNKLVTCVQAFATPATNDKSIAAASESKSDRVAQRLEATEIVTNIAADAALQGFRIVNDAADREKLDNPDVIWLADGLVGTANMLDQFEKLTIDQIAAVRSAAGEGCEKGKSTATKREVTDGVVAINVMISCTTEKGDSSTSQMLFVERRPGVVFEFSFLYVESPDGADTGDSSAQVGPAIKDAVLTVLKPQ